MSYGHNLHKQKINVKGRLVQNKVKTDGETDGTDCITFPC